MISTWCIVADDFTGTGDTAVQFCSDGRPVRLLLGQQPGHRSFPRSQTVVIDTDSRYLDAETAYRKVRGIVELLHSSGQRRFFKKIDSTLRGNVAAEISAVMDGAGYDCAIVAPSAPRNGRTVSNGICRIDGVPIGSTEALRDPFTPVAEARVASLFEERFAGRVEGLDLSAMRAAPDELLKRVREGRARGTKIFVADAESLEDLAAVAGLAREKGLLFVGSSGLAEALSNASRPLSAKKHFSHPAIAPGQSLFIVGSVAATTTAQCEVFAADPRVASIELDCAAFARDSKAERDRLLGLVRARSANEAILLRTNGAGAFSSDVEAVKEQGARISRFLGEICLAIARERRVRFLFASGGDTAARMTEALGAETIDFVDEILPGLPLGYISSRGLGRRVYFVSKSGGFGAPDAMISVLSRISAGDSETKESSHAAIFPSLAHFPSLRGWIDKLRPGNRR